MMQPEQIEQHIAAVEALYRQFAGSAFKPGAQPYAPIPPEADPEAYVLERLEQLQNTLATALNQPAAGTPVVPTRINVLESDKDWICQFEVTGIGKPDLALQIDLGVLRCTGMRREQANGSRLVHAELVPCRIERSVPLPYYVKSETVRAKLENGLLSVRFEKGTGAGPRKETTVAIQ
jgi:HSP20 family molecular chaperone IbpA